MKKYRVIVWALALALAGFAGAANVFARDNAASGASDDERKSGAVINSERDADSDGEESERGNATSTAAREREDDEDEDEDNATSTATRNKEKSEAGRGDEHRSEVAKFVKTLLEVADRTGGIGEKVRVIAREQASSTDKVASALDKVEKRGAFKIFLLGSDYKNLGSIRSELANTEKRLSRLNDALIKVNLSAEDKAKISAEITALKEEESKLDKFVNDNEEKFSLFGWFVKIFR